MHMHTRTHALSARRRGGVGSVSSHRVRREQEHTLADDPAAVHVGGTIAMALIYYTSCCSGSARPTTLDYKPLAQAVAMLRFISRVPGWGDIAPLSPITGPRGPLNGWQEPKHWTDDGWAGSLDPASPAA